MKDGNGLGRPAGKCQGCSKRPFEYSVYLNNPIGISIPSIWAPMLSGSCAFQSLERATKLHAENVQ